jgi:transcription termination factor Rho
MHDSETSGTGEAEIEVGEPSAEGSTTGDKPAGERPSHNQKPSGSDRPQRHDRGHGDRGQGDRNQGERNQGDRSKGDRSKSKKEGFNTLDLSGVKIGEDKKD